MKRILEYYREPSGRGENVALRTSSRIGWKRHLIDSVDNGLAAETLFQPWNELAFQLPSAAKGDKTDRRKDDVDDGQGDAADKW